MLISTGEHWIDLRCHPSTRAESVHAIRVQIQRSASAELQVTFRLDGDLHRIMIPPPDVPRIGKELWRHTCFEAFIAREGQVEYHEFNFSPSREWALYGFKRYRDGGPLADEKMTPQINVRSTDTRLELNARVRLDRLSNAHSSASLRVGLAAVIQTGDGFSYWALRHPAHKPDFHHADGFSLPLEPPGSRR